MKALLTMATALSVFMMFLADINYRQAKNAIMHTDRTDADIVFILEFYGFEPKGDPFYDPNMIDKVCAIFNYNPKNQIEP